MIRISTPSPSTLSRPEPSRYLSPTVQACHHTRPSGAVAITPFSPCPDLPEPPGRSKVFPNPRCAARWRTAAAVSASPHSAFGSGAGVGPVASPHPQKKLARERVQPPETSEPDWDGPAQNPEFNGATPRDLARALLRLKAAASPATAKVEKQEVS